METVELSEIIKLTNGKTVLTTRLSTAILCPMVAKAIALGLTSPIFLDLEDDVLRALLEVCRNGHKFCPIEALESPLNSAFSADIDRTLADYTPIHLNIAGEEFVSTRKTLIQAGYFAAHQHLSSDGPIELGLIDRDPIAFAHILRHLRQPNYVIPIAYQNDVIFWGIPSQKPAQFNEQPVTTMAMEMANPVGSPYRQTPECPNLNGLYGTRSLPIHFWSGTSKRNRFVTDPRLYYPIGPSVAETDIRFTFDWRAGDIMRSPWLVLQLEPDVVWDTSDPCGIALLLESAKLIPNGCSNSIHCPTVDSWTSLFTVKELNLDADFLTKPIRGMPNSYLIPLGFTRSETGYVHGLLYSGVEIVVRLVAGFRGLVSILFDSITFDNDKRRKFAISNANFINNGPYQQVLSLSASEDGFHHIDLDWYSGGLTSVLVQVEGEGLPGSVTWATGDLLIGGIVKASFSPLLEARSAWSSSWDTDSRVHYRMDFSQDPTKQHSLGFVGIAEGSLALRIKTSSPDCIIRVWLYGYRVLSFILNQPRCQSDCHRAHYHDNLDLQRLPPVTQRYLLPPVHDLGSNLRPGWPVSPSVYHI